MALPWLNHFLLALLSVLGVLASGKRWRALLRLIGRARWLFLLLGLGYAYSLPGEAAVPWMGGYSPSWPGVQAGLAQMLRLLLLLVLLERWVLSMGHERLLNGLHSLLQPLRWVGFPVERTTVRLALTLEAMESRRFRRHDIAGLLAEQNPAASSTETYALSRLAWRPRDTLALGLGLALLAWIWPHA